MIYDQSILQTKTAKHLVNIIKLLLNKRTRENKETITHAKQAVSTFTRADNILMEALKKRRKTDPNDRRGRRAL
jgi:hypothetical protein